MGKIRELKNQYEALPSKRNQRLDILDKIKTMLDECNLKPNDIDKIIVVNGPGSFTGIRIGITIAKVYAWSLNIPITTIYSLEAMSLSGNPKKIHVPMINARRGYVFAAIYDENQKAILKPQHILISDLEKELQSLSNYEIISNDEFKEFPSISKYNPDFNRIIKEFKDKECINPHAVNPEYLKLTEAEESKL